MSEDEQTPEDAEKSADQQPEERSDDTESESSVQDEDSVLEEAASDSHEKHAGKHILVVEDTKLLRAMLVKIVTEMGHVVDEADNGHYALAMARRARASGWGYDLILTDLMMPEMDGWTLIRQLKEKKFFPAIPVIVLTANAGRDSVLKCAHMGISQYIVKPFKAERVIETINKALVGSKFQENGDSDYDDEGQNDNDGHEFDPEAESPNDPQKPFSAE